MIKTLVVIGITLSLVYAIIKSLKKEKSKEFSLGNNLEEYTRDFTEELELHRIYVDKQMQNEFYEEFGSHDRQKARDAAERQKRLEPILLERYKYYLPNVVIRRKSVVSKKYARAAQSLKNVKIHIRKMNKQQKPPSNSASYQTYLNEYMMWRKRMEELEAEIESYQLEHLILYQEYKRLPLNE